MVMKSDEFIDITTEHCPMTFVRVKLKLEEMEAGQTLTVRLNGGEPLENVPQSLKGENYSFTTPEADGDCLKIVVTKPKQ